MKKQTAKVLMDVEFNLEEIARCDNGFEGKVYPELDERMLKHMIAATICWSGELSAKSITLVK